MASHHSMPRGAWERAPPGRGAVSRPPPCALPCSSAGCPVASRIAGGRRRWQEKPEPCDVRMEEHAFPRIVRGAIPWLLLGGHMMTNLYILDFFWS